MRTHLKLVPVGPKPQPRAATVQERVTFEPTHSAINFEDILRLTGGKAKSDKDDPVVFQGQVEFQMRQLIAKYGFDRLPLTYGELFGLINYCDGLEAASGKDTFPPEELKLWQTGSLAVWARNYPDRVEAATLYCQDDLPALQALHRREATLQRLGDEFVEGQAEDEAEDDDI
jgi:hypothetical protein